MENIKTLICDIETYSSENLGKCGVYRYSEACDFEILLFGFSINDGEITVVDLACGETIPDKIIKAIQDPDVIKYAHNSTFERMCMSRYLNLPQGEYLDSQSWRCTMTWAAYMGLPLSLEGVGTVLKLDKQKLTEGKDLIKYFCQPCAPTKSNGGRNRNCSYHDTEKWERFKEYNKCDVEAEIAIKKRLEKYPVPEYVWDEYHLSENINDRGVALDMMLVNEAIEMDCRSRSELIEAIKKLTNLENPNSVVQMKEWLANNGLETDTLGKKAVAELLKTAPSDLQAVLSLRQQLAKSSIKKYQAMQNCVCGDGRARGMFLFYGANRTGRAAGRLIQCQNLPQNHMTDLRQARSLVRCGYFDTLNLLYDNVPEVLSELIRTAFIPKDGCKFIVADFSSIEAVVLAWLAGEKWTLEAYSAKRDLYIENAEIMFGAPKGSIDKKSPLRQKSKIAVLACIAEGQLVLTDKGLVPIEDIALEHRLWDGEGWIGHEGVIYKGEGEVIEYDGLIATPDHIVWIEGQSEPIQFGIAVARKAHLIQTGDGQRAIRVGEDAVSGANHSRCGDSSVRKAEELANHQRKARLYDIRNAGSHHRFTVSGKLVHNCGYQGSVGALKAFGALEMGLKEEELKPLVDAWRAANPKVVRFWWDADKAAKTAVKEKRTTETHGIRFVYQSGMLFITLPSGRKLAYVKPRIGENRFGSECVTYEGIGATKKWERIESSPGKWVENITQAVARDILYYALSTLRTIDVVMHIHDEVVIEADMHVSHSAVCEQMSRTPPWAKGLPLRCESYDTPFYRKE